MSKTAGERREVGAAADGIEIDVQRDALALVAGQGLHVLRRARQRPFLDAEKGQAHAATKGSLTCGASARAAASTAATPLALSMALSPPSWPSMWALSTIQSSLWPGTSNRSVWVSAGCSTVSISSLAIGQPRAVRPRRGGGFRRNPGGGNAATVLATRGPRDELARHGPGDQKSHRARLHGSQIFAAAMDGAGDKHQFVPHEHDAALDVGSVGGELLGRAAAQVDDLGLKTAGRRCHAAHQRLAGDPGAVRARSATPRAPTSRRKERACDWPSTPVAASRLSVHMGKGARFTFVPARRPPHRREPQSLARALGRRRSLCPSQGSRSCQCPQVSRLLSLSDSSVRKAWVRIEGSRSPSEEGADLIGDRGVERAHRQAKVLEGLS